MYTLETVFAKKDFSKALTTVYAALKWGDKRCLMTGLYFEKDDEIFAVLGFTINEGVVVIHLMCHNTKQRKTKEIETHINQFPLDVVCKKVFRDLDKSIVKIFEQRMKAYTFSSRSSSRVSMKTSFYTIAPSPVQESGSTKKVSGNKKPSPASRGKCLFCFYD